VKDKIVLEGFGRFTTRENWKNTSFGSRKRPRKPEESRRIATLPDAARHGALHNHSRNMFTKILYRPALAIVISIILLFLGVLGIKTLPVAQFPNVTPPTVRSPLHIPVPVPMCWWTRS